MLRNLGNTKRIKRNENDVDEAFSLRGNKQFGPSAANKPLTRSNDSPALKLKSANQKEEQHLKPNEKNQKIQVFNDKNSSTKERSSIPLKRTESAIGSLRHSQSKKQNIQVEKTHRHKEKEIEWAPEGLDLDFSGFDSAVQESDYHSKEQVQIDTESFPVIERQFNVEPELQIEAPEATPEVEQDTSTVEYCPPREKEIPYKPDESCIIDISSFAPYADMDAYELVHLPSKDLEFTLPDDEDVSLQLTIKPIDDASLEFEYELEELNEESDLMTSDDDFSSIPYNDYTFDVDHFIECN